MKFLHVVDLSYCKTVIGSKESGLTLGRTVRQLLLGFNWSVLWGWKEADGPRGTWEGRSTGLDGEEGL